MVLRRYGMWGIALGAAAFVGCGRESPVDDAREEVIEERQETREAEAEHAEAQAELRQERTEESYTTPPTPAAGYSADPGAVPPTTEPAPVTPDESATRSPQSDATPGLGAGAGGADTGDRPSAVEAAEAESATPAPTGEGSPDASSATPR